MTKRHVLLAVHLTLVLSGLAYLVLSLTVGSTPDANIGAGLALLWLTALGLPWSLPIFALDLSLDVQSALVVASALLNVALHAAAPALRRLVTKRATRDSGP